MATTDTVLFLCSGGGGNLRFIHQLANSGLLSGVKSVAVVADRPCHAVDWAESVGLSNKIVSITRNDQSELVEACAQYASALVVTNIHRVLRPEVLSACSGQLMNLHYSLLPSFAGTIGMRSLTDALDYGARIVGATAHHVTEELDGGQPIAQAAFEASPLEDGSILADAMFRAGCLALYSAIYSLSAQSASTSPATPQIIHGRWYMISPYHGLPQELNSEAFWEGLKQ